MTALLLAAAALSPALRDLYVTNGSAPFAGDRALLTTVSPNGDGFRDAAFVHFRLTRPARVAMDVVATDMSKTCNAPAGLKAKPGAKRAYAKRKS